MSMFNQPVQSNKSKPVFSANDSLEAFFHHGVSLHKLEEGEYTALIQSFELVPAKTSEQKPYIRVELNLIDDGRVIVDNVFQTGFGIMIENLKEQLGLQKEDIAVQDLLNQCTKEEFKVWIKYVTLDNRTFRNVYYRKPKEDAEQQQPVKIVY